MRRRALSLHIRRFPAVDERTTAHYWHAAHDRCGPDSTRHLPSRIELTVPARANYNRRDAAEVSRGSRPFRDEQK